MIPRGSNRFEPWMSGICRIVSPESTRISGENPDDDLIYIGAGYWRAALVRDDSDLVIGCRLINPDRTPDEIQTVERAVCILMRIRD